MLMFPLRLLACAAFVALPLAAIAQTESFYVAPKLVQPGKNTTALAGPGNVTVQVQVKKDGTFAVIKVTKSTNPGDNAAALEIANSSKYKPATRDAKPVDAYYDYELKFGGDTAATGTGGIASALATIRQGKYDQAKSDLQTYLQSHPGDTQAYTLLGVANTFGGDPAAAAAAFDKAGTVPDQYKPLAIQSYQKAASADLKAKQFPDAAAAAGHLIDLDPQNPDAYNLRGTAEIGAQNDAAAIADLQKARSLALAAKGDQKMLTTISYNLAVAQLDAGQYGEAATSAKQVAGSDTALSAQLNKFAYTDIVNAAVPLANAGKISDAVSRLESGAAAFPSNGGTLLAEAAYIMALDKKPDWDKIQAEAEKALALDPNAGRADYLLGLRASQKQDPKSALDYMNKAKSTTAYGSDPGLAKMVDDALTKLNPPGK
jgi:tetratricopeptide (TPR) repeat protein